ncbi:MAG: hypothetical protein ACYC3S_07310 [Chloroflexota bacterium]
MRTHFWRLTLTMLLFVLSGCTTNTGLPSRSGDYSLQQGSVCADGDRYRFGWVDESGTIHQADAKVTSVTRDDRSYLELQGNDKAALRLGADESVPVCPDRQNRPGWASWIPIPIPFGGPVIIQRPGDAGGQSSDGKQPLGIPKQAPNPFSVGGQSGGTGGGTSAGGKSVSPSSGQSGGTGGGGAATGKGIFGGGSSGGSAPKITIPKIGGGRSFGGGRR